jgi:uncharacterized protein with HEPN domain
MNKRDKIILKKIVDEATTLEQMLQGIDETIFLSNEEKMRAVCMTLINIGELVKNLNNEFRQEYNQVPWKNIAGLRDVAAHGYFTLKMPDIWIYASMELPMYAAQIKGILETGNEET